MKWEYLKGAFILSFAFAILTGIIFSLEHQNIDGLFLYVFVVTLGGTIFIYCLFIGDDLQKEINYKDKGK